MACVFDKVECLQRVEFDLILEAKILLAGNSEWTGWCILVNVRDGTKSICVKIISVHSTSFLTLLEQEIIYVQPIGLLLWVRYIKTKRQVRNLSPAERDTIWAVRHEWGGEKVHNLVLDMSGFYVKSAQILATKAVSLSNLLLQSSCVL